MKILKPTKQVPHRWRTNRWYMVYASVDSLKDGEWLPVRLESAVQARKLYNSARQAGYSVTMESSTSHVVYVSRKLRA